MMTAPPSPSSYETVLQDLLAGLAPVTPEPLPLARALGRVSAGTAAEAPLPSGDIARRDGRACRALDLVGASALAPVMLSASPAWVSVGEALPAGTDCLLDPALIEDRGPFALALGEALPGEGVLRAGDWLAKGEALLGPGARVSAADLALARAAGLESLSCRVPRVALLNRGPGALGAGQSEALLRDALQAAGAEAISVDRGTPLADFGTGHDLVVVLGGTGQGPGDDTAAYLAQGARLLHQGLGLVGAATTLLARVDKTMILALPGAPEAALAAALALLFPALDRLSGRAETTPLRLPLRRKLASDVGQAEVVMLAREQGAGEQGADGAAWVPLSRGLPSLAAWGRAEAVCVVASGEEGWAAGAPLGARLLQGGLPL